jgi:hypothetical protein
VSAMRSATDLAHLGLKRLTDAFRTGVSADARADARAGAFGTGARLDARLPD